MWRLTSPTCPTSPFFPDSEEGLKREGGAFDLETILFLDLSDRGNTPVHMCVPSHCCMKSVTHTPCETTTAFLPLPLPSSPPFLQTRSSLSGYLTKVLTVKNSQPLMQPSHLSCCTGIPP